MHLFAVDFVVSGIQDSRSISDIAWCGTIAAWYYIRVGVCHSIASSFGSNSSFLLLAGE